LNNSILEQQSYWLTDTNGGFSVISSLTINDTKSCPVFNAWKKCRYAKQDTPEGKALWLQQAKKDEGGRALFDKRFARYVTVQVIDDPNQPNLNGQYLFWKLPKSIWEMVEAKIKPTDPKKASIPVMDFLFGRAIDIEVKPGPDDKSAPERKTREISYLAEFSEDIVSCVTTDGKPLLSDDEQEILDEYISKMKKVWKSKDPDERKEMVLEINKDENTKELRKIYSRVLDEIKQVCPNLMEHLGYKPISESLLPRVNAWIEKVLAGKDPANTVDAPASIDSVKVEKKKDSNNNSNKGSESVTPTVSVETKTEEEDDLPF
jgi:hypothetical protein